MAKPREIWEAGDLSPLIAEVRASSVPCLRSMSWLDLKPLSECVCFTRSLRLLEWKTLRMIRGYVCRLSVMISEGFGA